MRTTSSTTPKGSNEIGGATTPKGSNEIAGASRPLAALASATPGPSHPVDPTTQWSHLAYGWDHCVVRTVSAARSGGRWWLAEPRHQRPPAITFDRSAVGTDRIHMSIHVGRNTKHSQEGSGESNRSNHCTYAHLIRQNFRDCT